MLVAQAMDEGMLLLSHDANVVRYGDYVMQF